MLLQINERWRIVTDPHNFILQFKGKSTAKDAVDGFKWANAGYYNTLDNTFLGYSKIATRTSNAEGIDQVKQLLADIKAEVAMLKAESVQGTDFSGSR